MYSRREILGLFGAAALTPFATPVLIGCDPTTDREPVNKLMTLVNDYTVRKANERGVRNRGWLLAKHSFSFSDYRDPKYDSFGPMRVLNEDVIQPGKGFPMHPHRDMEIITYILDGALEHKDSLGSGGVISPGEVQKMSAGTGIRHSEFNPQSDHPVHLIQIWIQPDTKNIAPAYEQKLIPKVADAGPIRLIASPDGQDGSVVVRQDARIHACNLAYGEQVHFEVRPGRKTWVQVARGMLSLNGDVLTPGDALHTDQSGWLAFEAGADSELLVFDFAA